MSAKLPFFIRFANRVIPLPSVDGFEIDLVEKKIMCEYHVNQDYRRIYENYDDERALHARFYQIQNQILEIPEEHL